MLLEEYGKDLVVLLPEFEYYSSEIGNHCNIFIIGSVESDL